jgi:L-asparaginase / beta-aspartyl-peptidase
MSLYSIAIHGGAGTIVKEDMSPELEKEYRFGLEKALEKGYSILEKQGTAVEAVKAACMELEDNILFNAGRGSVFTRKGEHEMDAAIMNGENLKAGAVAGLRNIRNPIELAAEVMQHSQHVFLGGEGAIEFALKQEIKMEAPGYFFSQFRYDQWKDMRDSDHYALDHSNQALENLMRDKKFGTIGAVACDASGNLAAGTSTGGMTNKNYGRIGDTPVIGAGNYANNKTCAISCTGHGEIFLLAVAAYDVSCLMEYRGMSLQEAMKTVVHDKLVRLKGEGGMIGVDGNGNTAMIFNTPGMYRACRSSNGHSETGFYQ